MEIGVCEIPEVGEVMGRESSGNGRVMLVFRYEIVEVWLSRGEVKGENVGSSSRSGGICFVQTKNVGWGPGLKSGLQGGFLQSFLISSTEWKIFVDFHWWRIVGWMVWIEFWVEEGWENK